MTLPIELHELDFEAPDPLVETQREIAALWAGVPAEDMWDDPNKYEIIAWLEAEKADLMRRGKEELDQQAGLLLTSLMLSSCVCTPSRHEYSLAGVPLSLFSSDDNHWWSRRSWPW